MTFTQLQLKLQELFNELATSSNKMAELKNKCFQLEIKNKELEKTVEIAKTDYLKSKKSKMVNLNTFSIVKKARDTADLEYKQGKLNRAILQKEIVDLQNKIDLIKDQYENIDKLLKKSLDNVEKLNDNRRRKK